MNTVLTGVKFFVALLFVGASGYVLYQQAAPLLTPPCTTPVTYMLGTVDPRFGISESQLELALLQAASVWNTEAGKPLVVKGEEGILINLEYSEVQQATELGKNIDAEQAAYDAKKAEVNALKDSFDASKNSYERKAVAYDAAVQAYEEDVEYWNERGGAPPEEFERLKAKAEALEVARRSLNGEADEVNAFSQDINTAVKELNVLAQKINAKVNTYNKSAGEDFDQGYYIEDADGTRITIYEFEDREDLKRVLVHEFGHALGLEHVENPDSIMYSFNIGEGMTLTEEDKAELQRVCKLET